MNNKKIESKSLRKSLQKKECKHVSKEDWKLIMKTIENSRKVKSAVIVDGLNAMPLYVPTHDFKYFYPYNEFDEWPLLFFKDDNYLKWIVDQLKETTFFLRIHVCDPIEVMHKVIKKLPELNQISFHYFILTNECIKYLTENFPKLEVINFENSIGIKLEECRLFSQFKELQHLNLSGSDIYEESLEVLLKSCPKLKSLNISNNSGITGNCLTLINKSIERLDLRDCWRIDPQIIISMVGLKLQSLVELLLNSGVNDESMIKICDKCINIKHLTISFDYFTYTDIHGRRILSDCGFSAISKLEDLKILSLRHCGKLTDCSLQNILKGCKNLTQLIINVRHRHKLTDNALGDIGMWCPKIEFFESVHNQFIGKKSIESISKIPNLTALVLRGDKCVDNDITRVLYNCKKLLHLNVDGCNVDELVLTACIDRARQLQPNNQILKVSLISTNIDRSVIDLYEIHFPPNLRIRASGPLNYENFAEFNGKFTLIGKLSWFFPHYWIDFN